MKPPGPYKPQRALADLAGKMLHDAFARQGFASTELVTRWREIAGADIAALAEPERIRWPRNDGGSEPGVLVLKVQGPAAIEVQHQTHIILNRVNRFFGWQAIGQVRLRQAPLGRPVKPKRPAPPSAEAVATVAATLDDVADDGLRSALARWGAAVKRP